MKNIKRNFIIFIILYTVTMFFTASDAFAAHIGRTVYGVLTETYNGMAIDNSSAGADYAHMYGSGYDSADRLEGAVSASVGWECWFGVCFDSAQDMSAYSGGRLYFSAKVPTTVDIANAGNVFKISDGTDRVVNFNSTNIKRIDTGSTILGTAIVNDNAWHTYYIDLSNFSGLNLANITYAFIIGTTQNDNTLLIDNVYWTKAGAGARTFEVTIKNISDNIAVSSVAWSPSSFRHSWVAAAQYLELDLDYESSNWYVQILLNNGKASRNGLYNVDTSEVERVLQMAWRVSGDLLPNSAGDTLSITQSGAPNYSLYDSGKHSSDPSWYPWIYMKEINDTFDIAYTTVWNLRGCHTYAGANDAWDTLRNFYEKKPKIYLCANCADAIGGLVYEAGIVISLVYE